MQQVKNGDTIKVHYTGKLNNGEVFDSSVNKEPLQFEMGKGQMISGFEQAVIGMSLQESKTVDIPSDAAYGSVREDLIHKVPVSQLPEGLNPQVGHKLESLTPEGQQFVVNVIEVDTENITIDANHPLAGKDITFEIELISIN